MKRIAVFTTVMILTLTFLPHTLPAAQIAGVTLDDTLKVGDRTVTLTGMGVRTKTFLKIKVYAAGLYMEKPSLLADEIITSDQAKAMVMIFLYKEVEGEKLQEAWREGFAANTPAAEPDLKRKMDNFVSLFKDPASKGQRYVFAYVPGTGTTVNLGTGVIATIPGADFASALMAIWFGDELGDGGLKTLKKSMLEGM